MELKRRTKVSAEFNMASMTDLIFLLLIFFMLTSNFVTPSALPVNLPSSSSVEIVITNINLTISKDLQYDINGKKVSEDDIEPVLRNELKEGENVVVLHIDESVDVKYFVKVAGIASKLGAKVSIAAKEE
ncbi:MAG: ExbD/TolR family protein [Cytophagaceae bacterium]